MTPADPPRRPRTLREQSAAGDDPIVALDGLVRHVRSDPGGASEANLLALAELYRYASTETARLEASGHDPRALAELRTLVGRAHALLYAPDTPSAGALVPRAVRFLLVDSPAAVWAERKLLGVLGALFYGLAAISFLAVRADLELAYTLQPPVAVNAEIEQLRETDPGETFRGNFTFGLGKSPIFSGLILTNNIYVSTLFFGAGLVPPLFLYILVNNGLMLGTYTGVAGHWDQAAAISSFLWCHGVIELQMILLAGAAGLVLARAWIAPGVWSRGEAMARESRRAWALMAPVFPLLTLSGLVEGYVSPHAPLVVRALVGAGSAVLLVAWIRNGVLLARAAGGLGEARGEARGAAQ